MSEDCGRILNEGVTLLRDFADGRAAPEAARARVAAWRATYPGLRADLLVHKVHASSRIEHDLLLGLPNDSADTIALSWCPDRCEPWAINYADHWASNYLVTVNDIPTTVQQALLYLGTVQRNQPDLMDIIIEHHLLSEGARENPPSVSTVELQEAADRFRQAHDLLTEAKTHQWLTEVRLSVEQFEQLIRENVQRRKFRDALVEEQIESYFETRRAEFDVVRVFQARAPDCETAEDLAAEARSRGDLRAALDARFCEMGCMTGWAGTFRVAVARQLPAWIDAPPGVVLGPCFEHEGWHLAQILSRMPAPGLQGATREAAADAVFQQWVAQRRANALIRWHWMS